MTPFVGREHELRVLQSGIDQASSGSGGSWLLVGPAGIGKTRLADELAAGARQRGVTVLWGRCWEGEGAPAFWPWVQVLRSYARTLDDETLRSELGAGAGSIAELVDEIHTRLPGIPTPPELEAEQQRFRLFDSIATFLANAAAHRPLLLILDDLHWADMASLRLLQFVARETRTTPLLTVAALRDPELPANDPIASTLAAMARHGQRIDLHGLTEPELGELIESLDGSKPAPAVLRQVYDRTDGNPFFTTEILRLWQAEGRPEGGTEAVPPGVRHTIRRRLVRFTSACQQLLAVAAVVGREFQLGIVAPVFARAAGMPDDRAALLALIDEALASRLLETMPLSIDRYRFSHALVRETLVEELGSVRRAQMHRMVGEAIEVAYADDLEPHWAELAHHFVAAAAAGDAERGIDYATRAAAHASRVQAHEAASLHLLAALRIVDLTRAPARNGTDAGASTPAQRRCALLVALGEARARSGDMPAAHDAFRLAVDLARRLGMAEALCRAAVGLAGTDVTTRVDAPLVELLDEALTACESSDSPLRVRLLSRLATALYFSAERERRARLSAEAVRVAERLGDPAALALALGAQHFALWGPDDVDGRLVIANRIITLSTSAGRKDLLLGGHFWRVLDALEVGDIAAADESIRCYAELANEMREPYYLWRACGLRAMRTLLRGDFAEGEGLVEHALALGQRARSPNAALIYGVQLYGLRREQGRLDEIEPAIAAFAAEQKAIPAFRAGLALLYTHLGRLDAARIIFNELALDDFRTLPRDANWLNAMDELAQVCTTLGDEKRAAVLYDLLRPYARQNVVVAFADACDGSVARYLGMLATTLSQWAVAAEHFEAAIAMNRALGARPLVAHTQREYAAMLHARGLPGDDQRADALLDAAATIYRELGTEHNLSVIGTAPGADGPYAVPTDHAPPASASAFVKQGDVWMIAYAGTSVRLRDAKGFHYLAHLVRHPGRDWHVFDLVAAVGRRGDALREGDGGRLRHSGSAGSGPDARAKAAYGQRLAALRDELENAQDNNDGSRAAAAQREIDLLSIELGRAYRLGAAREPNEPLEKARKAVSNRLRAALARLQHEHPALARHFAVTVRIGTYCSYRPEHPPAWQLE